MGWTETHRRWQALQEIEALANAAAIDTLPWTPEYAEIFADRDTLAAALRHRWDQTRQAQLDTHLPERVLEQLWCRLHERHAGVLRLLAAYDEQPRATADAVALAS
jgi:hypothetical protein